jgi:hypothetical protein
MADIPTQAFNDGVTTLTYERPPKTQDPFGTIVSDDERKRLLNLPTPLLAEAVAETIVGITDENQRRTLLQRITTMGMGRHEPSPKVQELLDFVQGKESVIPFSNGADFEYLAIFCGFVAGTRLVKENVGNKEAKEIVAKLSENAEKKSNGNPQQKEVMEATKLIEGKIFQ